MAWTRIEYTAVVPVRPPRGDATAYRLWLNGRHRVRRAMVREVKETEQQARQRCPVRTGRMQFRIRSGVRARGNTVYGFVRCEMFYAAPTNRLHKTKGWWDGLDRSGFADSAFPDALAVLEGFVDPESTRRSARRLQGRFQQSGIGARVSLAEALGFAGVLLGGGAVIATIRIIIPVF